MWLPKTQKGRAKFLLRRANAINTYEAGRLTPVILRESCGGDLPGMCGDPRPSLPLRVESLGHLQMLL
jgi:hypothetical protein